MYELHHCASEGGTLQELHRPASDKRGREALVAGGGGAGEGRGGGGGGGAGRVNPHDPRAERKVSQKRDSQHCEDEKNREGEQLRWKISTAEGIRQRGYRRLTNCAAEVKRRGGANNRGGGYYEP